jgi:hypothetical protein
MCFDRTTIFKWKYIQRKLIQLTKEKWKERLCDTWSFRESNSEEYSHYYVRRDNLPYDN